MDKVRKLSGSDSGFLVPVETGVTEVYIAWPLLLQPLVFVWSRPQTALGTVFNCPVRVACGLLSQCGRCVQYEHTTGHSYPLIRLFP
jgi:hypothetical protein